MKLGIVVGFFIMIFVSFQTSAEIYKWTNAAGELVYSQSPPPQGINATVVDPEIHMKGVLDEVDVTETPKDKSVDTSASVADELAEKCEIARNNIEKLGQATSETEFKAAASGQRTYTQDELNANIKISQDFMNTWCDQ